MNRPSVQEVREVFGLRRLLESEVVRLFAAKALMNLIGKPSQQHGIPTR